MRTNRTFPKVFLLDTSHRLYTGYPQRPGGRVHFVLVCYVRCVTLFQNVQNRPIFDLRLSVHSCIIQGIRKVEKLSTLERLKMSKVYAVENGYDLVGLFSTLEKAEAFINGSTAFDIVEMEVE